jgi:hypothetical protein
LEGTFHDVLHFGLGEWPKHSPSDDFFFKVGFDLVVVVFGGGVIGENDGFGQRGKFAHREAISEVAGQEWVRAREIMFLQEDVEGIWIVWCLDMRENILVFF